jgi:exonuclease III
VILGERLDHLLLSETIAQRLVAAGVDRNVRGLSNASDHAPAWVEIFEQAPSMSSTDQISEQSVI